MLRCCECSKQYGDATASTELFATLNDLEAHLVEEHFSNCCIYECPICKYTRFPTEFALVQHCRSFHRDVGRIQLKQSVDIAKLESRDLIHQCLNNSVREMLKQHQSEAPKQSTIEKTHPQISSSSSCRLNSQIFHSMTPSSSANSFIKSASIPFEPRQEWMEPEIIPQFTTRRSQLGGTLLISGLGYEYRKSKNVANCRGIITYRCNANRAYRDCKARVIVEMDTGVGTFKDQQHNHPPPLPLQKLRNGRLGNSPLQPGAESSQGVRKLKRGIVLIVESLWMRMR